MSEQADPRDAYVAACQAVQTADDGRLPVAVRRLRGAAIERFRELGFPTGRMEEWRFTSVAPIAETAFALAPTGTAGVGRRAIAPFLLHDPAAVQLVFVGGRYVPALSSPGGPVAGLEIGGLGECLGAGFEAVEPYLARFARWEDQAFAALNTAFLSDGAYVRVRPGTVVGAPIHLLFLAAPATQPVVCHPRSLVVVGENSHVSLVETYAGAENGTYLTNAVTEIVAAPNAVVDHYKVLRESRRGYHVATMHVALDRSGSFSSHSITLGGALVRNDVVTVLGGEGGECTLNGLYLANGRRLVDNHTTIEHARPHCTSHELYKGILDGQSRGVFNGKIIVRPDAQKTDAKQTNKVLLLSEDAQINTKPQLEIFADDVRCTHGATVGQLDAEALFYLRARGLSEERARSMLIHAFASDILSRIRIAPIRTELEAVMLEQLRVMAEDEVCYEQPD